MKGYRAKLAKESVRAETMRGNQRQASRVLSLRSFSLCPSSPELQQHGQGVVPWGSSLEAQCPQVFIGVDDIGTLYLAYTKIPDSQRENSVLHKSKCLDKQISHREPLYNLEQFYHLEKI